MKLIVCLFVFEKIPNISFCHYSNFHAFKFSFRCTVFATDGPSLITDILYTVKPR